jgi:Sulfotransferase family
MSLHRYRKLEDIYGGRLGEETHRGFIMVLLIGGHQRSGTTLLRDICHFHPDICITHEFQNFLPMGKDYRAYQERILDSWRRKGLIKYNLFRRSPQFSTGLRGVHVFRGHIFTARYILKLQKYRYEKIDAGVIQNILYSLFPKARIVGDKWPDYVFSLERFSGLKDFKQLVIYRDCRDVVSSMLIEVRTNWQTQEWTKTVDTAEKIARRWIRAIEAMERYSGNLHIIRYEDLVCNPVRELRLLSEWLDVNPNGFPVKMIQDTRIGKFQNGLSKSELKAVMKSAGPTMERLGYY